MKKSARSCVEEFDRRDLVYLSPYSNSGKVDNFFNGPCTLSLNSCAAVLEEVVNSKVYVIGAVVDKNVTKVSCSKLLPSLSVNS